MDSNNAAQIKEKTDTEACVRKVDRATELLAQVRAACGCGDDDSTAVVVGEAYEVVGLTGFCSGTTIFSSWQRYACGCRANKRVTGSAAAGVSR